MRKLILGFLVFSMSYSLSIAQVADKNIDGLNAYVQYVNETVHGILIIQRLLQDFNQQINKYVDLDGYPYQDFGNEYLPKNILAASDYYKPTPEELYQKLELVRSHKDLSELNALCLKIRNIARAMNKIRFDVEDYMISHDLNNPKQLQGVYAVSYTHLRCRRRG